MTALNTKSRREAEREKTNSGAIEYNVVSLKSGGRSLEKGAYLLLVKKSRKGTRNVEKKKHICNDVIVEF